MSAARAFALSILAGLIASGMLLAVNAVLVQPYTNALADIELEEQLAEGEFDEEEFDTQMQSISNLQRTGALALGLAGGALVGGTYFFAAKSIRASPVLVGVLIAGAAWFALYVVPAVKYPPNPEALFDPESAYYSLAATYLAVSGLAALGAAAIFAKIKRKNKAFGAAALYLAAVAVAFFVFPSFEDANYLPQSLLAGWRSAIAAAMTAFWFSLGIISGLLWQYGGKRAVKEQHA